MKLKLASVCLGILILSTSFATENSDIELGEIQTAASSNKEESPPPRPKKSKSRHRTSEVTEEIPTSRAKSRKSGRTAHKARATPSIVDESDEITVDLSQLMRSNFYKHEPEESDGENVSDSEQEEVTGCCCFSKGCCIKCRGEMNILSRTFWTVSQSISSSLASLSHYARRSIIPLAAFGNFAKGTTDNLLIWIAILQTVGESCEIIHDFGVTKAIRTQKRLKNLDEQYEQEKQRKQDKALIKCAECTTPKLRITTLSNVDIQDSDALRELYNPVPSRQMNTLAAEMRKMTDLTGCEKGFYSLSKCFWTNTYSFFWFAEVALSLTQLIIVVADMSQKDALTLSILLMITEAAHYFCNRMKHTAQDKTFETYKFRKSMEDIANGAVAGEEAV